MPLEQPDERSQRGQRGQRKQGNERVPRNEHPDVASYREAVRRAVFPPTLALVVLAGLLAWLVASLVSAARAVERCDAVIAQATATLKLALDAETGQRGYLVGGNSTFLAPYTLAQAQLPTAFDSLGPLVADDPAQLGHVRAARATYTRWEENAKQEIALRQRGDNGDARDRKAWITAFNSGRGKVLMDELRRDFADLTATEETRRGTRSRTAQNAARAAFVGGTLATLAIGGILAFATRRNMGTLVSRFEQTLDEEQEAKESLGATLYGIGDAVLVTDERGFVVRMNPVAESLTGWTEAEAKGKSAKVVFDIVNETTRQVVDSPVDRVIREGMIVGLANHTVLRHRDGGEVAIDDSGAPVRGRSGDLVGVVLVFRDVSERRRQDAELAGALNRETLVNTVGAAIRDSPLDADAILRTAVSALGQAISADRCYFGRYDQSSDYARLSPEWFRDGLPPIEGEYPMSRFSINRDPSYKAGGTQVVEDVRAFAPPGANAEPSPLEALGLRAMIRVPIQLGNGMTTLAVAMSGGPRRWTENEVRAVETVASQVQSALEAARLLAEERTREREARQRAERESVLNQIGTAIRASLPPAEVEAVAVSALGRALGADRCYLSVVDAARDSVVIGRDWCPTEGVPTLTGKYRLSEFAVDVDEVFGGGETLTVTDTQAEGAPWGSDTAAVLSGMGVRAMINVPFHENGQLVAALGVAMAREPRQWTPEEVALVEAVATETRKATEAARARQREHTIAEQLQEALTPAPPTEAPGLTLASYYRPALDEAGVGGDWMDVFPLGGGRGTAIVVADQSGKGLAAAAQVATVRNMLRAILYESGSVGDTVNRLNTILAEHDLLTGFATLFIGTYVADTASGMEGTLSYASCGQEPGLVWRAATGEVEELGPTGPVLGAFVGAEFGEQTITLSAGDILALFTDGLTEAGPNRKDMLDIKGVASLFAEAASDQEATAASVAARLIAEVDAFARGGVRDDVCLLVARVTG
ncbi:MAG: SpoIIE family protein phosphatase [Akkermansiaceae bacterium]|nr:SpoIIE family protein phosphatase [Armatimonadota bacterium]